MSDDLADAIRRANFVRPLPNDLHLSHLMSLMGVKRTWASAVQMSAFDPKRTFRTRATLGTN